ncbi:glycosyltransferase [Noviherbaspirillum sp. L7-7A]|uniref:glycosyltransferase n=1 Tax=Noviherbaspirillum sp. L7-7A TaxID=2850560 RepID=UPI001C2C6E47|nr:glycosyltransferase [Noviherbaspirillum sp. L7-7A]MBV0881742.1 glycosyltransferase [Noviherbaspirillum sp. L7-7A]
MDLAFWLSLAAFIAVSAVSVDVALGWRRITHLKDVAVPAGAHQPRVSLIVSALNEAGTIEPALRSLLAIDYPDLELIVIDDRSTDATGEIIDRLAARQPRLRALHLRELPPGWLGKNHALSKGAAAASGDYLLFTDADAVFAPSAVARAVAWCEARRVDHLTLFFDLVARPLLLRLMVISFAAAFMGRFRPWKTASSARHHIGIGGFNLVRRTAYETVGGHGAIPLAVLDDMELGRLLKGAGHVQHVLSGEDMVFIEWYRSTPELMRGLEKNVFAGFDYRLSMLAGVTVLVLITRVWPWLALLTTSGPAWWLSLATVTVGLALYLDLLRARKWPLRCLLFAPRVPAIELAIWWRACLLTLLRDGVTWRGTHYPLAQLRAAHRAMAARGK